MNNAHVVGSSFQKVLGPVAEQTLLLASSTEQCASGFPLSWCLLKHFPFTLLLFALSWSSKPQRMEANEIPQPLPHPSPPHSCWEWKWLRAIRLTLGTSRNINGVATTSSWSCHLHPTVLLFFFPLIFLKHPQHPGGTFQDKLQVLWIFLFNNHSCNSAHL